MSAFSKKKESVEDSSVHNTVAGLSSEATSERVAALRASSVNNLTSLNPSSPTRKNYFRRSFGSVGNFLKLSRNTSTNSFVSSGQHSETSSCNSSIGSIAEEESECKRSTSNALSGSLKANGKGSRLDSAQMDTVSFGMCQQYAKKDQDRYDIRLGKTVENQNVVFAGVFDGHGTSSFAADVCAKDLYNQVVRLSNRKGAEGDQVEETFYVGEELEDMDPMVSVPSDACIGEAFLRVHEKVASAARHEPRTGSCVVAAFSSQGADGTTTGKIAWAGDCSAILVNKKGKLKVLTLFHRIDSNPKEAERFNNASHSPREDILKSRFWEEEQRKAKSNNTRPRAHSFVSKRQLPTGEFTGENCIFSYSGGISLQVTRSIGDTLAARSVIPDPEIVEFSIRKEEKPCRLILFSDGVSDACSFGEIAKMSKKIPKARKIAKKIASHAKRVRLYSGQTIDDITVVAIDYNI